MYMAGVDILTARDQMGHADISTTLQIYTHLDKLYKHKKMNKLDEYLGQSEVSQSTINSTTIRLDTAKGWGLRNAEVESSILFGSTTEPRRWTFPGSSAGMFIF